MAERKNSDAAGGEGPSAPQAKSESKSGLKSELPRVESPPLSPGAEAPVKPGEPAMEPVPTRDRPRYMRLALMAASVVVAAGLGAMIGGAVTAGWQSKPSMDKASAQAVHERQAMQQALDRLSRQVASLRADLDKTSKATHSRIAKLSDRLESVRAQALTPTRAPETTGSIPRQKAASVPLPRPAPRIAAAASRPSIVPGWSIRDARGGFIYVESRGDIYQVVPGAYLPGLGPVQSIKRKDGHWAVVTPRGLIVSMSDRRYFE